MSYDPYSRICIPIHYAPVELKIGTQRGATDRALHGTSKEGGSRNDKSKTSCPACLSSPLSSPHRALGLPFREAHANRTRLNGEWCNNPTRERSAFSVKTFRVRFREFWMRELVRALYRSSKAVRTDVLNCVQTNHFGTIDMRKQLCNASALSNSIYVIVMLLLTHVVLRLRFVEEYLIIRIFCCHHFSIEKSQLLYFFSMCFNSCIYSYYILSTQNNHRKTTIR